MYNAVFVTTVITIIVSMFIIGTIIHTGKDIGLPIQHKGELGSEAVGDVAAGAGAGVGPDDHAALGSGAVPNGDDGGRRAEGGAWQEKKEGRHKEMSSRGHGGGVS